jgi:hypothetical protein
LLTVGAATTLGTAHHVDWFATISFVASAVFLGQLLVTAFTVFVRWRGKRRGGNRALRRRTRSSALSFFNGARLQLLAALVVTTGTTLSGVYSPTLDFILLAAVFTLAPLSWRWRRDPATLPELEATGGAISEGSLFVSDPQVPREGDAEWSRDLPDVADQGYEGSRADIARTREGVRLTVTTARRCTGPLRLVVVFKECHLPGASTFESINGSGACARFVYDTLGDSQCVSVEFPADFKYGLGMVPLPLGMYEWTWAANVGTPSKPNNRVLAQGQFEWT